MNRTNCDTTKWFNIHNIVKIIINGNNKLSKNIEVLLSLFKSSPFNKDAADIVFLDTMPLFKTP